MKPSIRMMTMGAALGAATLLGACHDDHAGAPPAAATSENFSDFAKQTFAMDENSTPVSVDLVLVNDVDTDPTAFDSLLM